jgi:hypothetical protein
MYRYRFFNFFFKLIIHQIRDGGFVNNVWMSNKINNTVSPRWAPVTLTMAGLCNGDKVVPLRIDVVNASARGSSGDQVIGSVSVSVDAMVNASGDPFPLRDARNNLVGTLTAGQASTENRPSFINVLYLFSFLFGQD